MPKSVEVPDFGVIEFPDEMDEAQIGSAIRQSVYKLPPLPEMAKYDQNTYRDRRFISENNLKTAAEDFTAKAIAFDKMSADIKGGEATTDEQTVSEAVKSLKLAEARKQMATRDWEGVQKDPAPLGASFQASLAQGGLNTAAAMADFGGAFMPAIPEAVEKNKAQIEKLNAEQQQLHADWNKPGPDGTLTEAVMRPRMQRLEQIRREREALERPRELTAAGQLAGAASQTFQNADINPAAPNTSAQVGRGLGAVAALSPTFLLGGASLPAAVMQIGGETYERAYTQKEDELKAQGADESEIHSAAQDFATVETIKAAPAFAAYMVGGKLASGVVGRLLPEGSRALRGFAGAAAGTGANVATGGIIRKFEGQNFAPTVEQLTQDILFGIAHGVGEARRTPERPAEAEQPRPEEPLSEAPPPTANETPLPAPESRPEAPQQTREATDPTGDALAPTAEAGPRTEGAVEGVGREMPEGEGMPGGVEPVPAEPRNLGPGAANIEEFGPQKTVAAYNDAVDKQRAERGLEPLMSEARKGSEEIWAQAEKRIESDPNYAADLVTAIKEGKKTSVDDVAQQALLWRMIDLQNRKAEAEIRAIDDKTYSPEERAEFAAQASELEGQLQVTEEANRKAGSASSSALNIRRQIANEDFTLAGMLRKGELSKGEKLTAPEIQKIQAQAEGIQGAEKAFQERTAKLEEETAGVGVDAAIKSIEAEAAKSPDFTPEVRSIADRIIDRLDRAADAALRRLRGKFAQLGSTPDPTILADLVILGSAKVGKGFVKFGKWAGEMVRELGEGVKPYLQEAWKQVDSSIDDVIAGSTADKAKRAKVKEAVAGTKGADAAEAISETLKERLKAGESIKDMRSMVQRLAENFVRSGVKGRDALVDRVHEVLKEADPGITRRQAMDLISGYGDFKPLNKDEVKAEVRDIKQQLQLVAKIEDVQKKIPLAKSGIERQKLSDESRRLTTELNEELKKYGSVVTDPAKQLQTMLAATETRLTNRIKDLKAEIAAGEQRVKSKTDRPTNDKIDALRKELKTVESEHKKLFDEPPISDAQKALDKALVERERLDQFLAGEIAPAKKVSKEARTDLENDVRAEIAAMRGLAADVRRNDPQAQESAQVKSLEKAAAEYERRLNDSDFSSTGKRQGPDTARVAQARALRDAAKTAFDAARKLTKPVRTKEEIALQNFKAMATRKAADLQDRIAKSDFAPRPKKPPLDISKDPEAVKLKAQADILRKEFNQQREKWLLDQRTAGKKFLDTAAEVIGSSRTLITSADISAPFRQGAFFSLGDLVFNPKRFAGQLGRMFTSLASEKKFQEAETALRLRPNADLYDKSGLYLSDIDGKFSTREETMRSDLAEKVPLVRRSNRAYADFLNQQRADTMDTFVDMMGGKENVTPEQAKYLASAINEMTGRGGIDLKHAGAANFLARFLFSPRFLISRFKVLVGEPIWRGLISGEKVGPKARAIVALQYGKFAAGLAALYGLAALSGASVNLDPRSTDFLKMRFGSSRLDPLGGLQQLAVLISRGLSGKVKSLSGDVRPVKFDTLGNFIRGKLAPIPGAVVDATFGGGKNVVGEKVTPLSTLKRLTLPISYEDAPAVYREHGAVKGTVLELLNLMGMGLQQMRK